MNEIQLTPLAELAIIVVTGVIAAFIALKLKLPSMVGYILAGLVLSIFLPILGIDEGLNSEFVRNLAELGVALLLFAAGIEFSLNNLRKNRDLVVAGSIAQVALVIIFGTLIMSIFKITSYEAFFIAVAAATSSTAFVLKMLEQKEEIHTQQGKIIVGWLLMQDVMIVALFLLLKTFSPVSDENISILDPIIRSVLVIGITFGIGKKIIPPVISQIAKVGSQELLLISVVALSIGLALFAEALGVSFTLGAFLAGLALADTFLQHEVFAETKPMRDLFTMIFFVSIGTLIKISSLDDNILPLIGIMVLLIPLKILVTFYINTLFNVHTLNAIKISFGISQIGEFAFLAISIGLAQSWIDNELYSLILIATIITMALTPLLYSYSDETYRFLERFFRSRTPRIYRKLFVNPRMTKDHDKELKNHIIICGYGKVGRYVTKAVSFLNEPYVVIDLDANLVQKATDDGHQIIYGDSTNKDVLESANIKRAKVIVVTLPQKSTNATPTLINIIRELNPKAEIIVRGHIDSNENAKYIENIIEPEFEAAVSIVNKLTRLEHSSNGTVRKLKNFRKKEIEALVNNLVDDSRQ